MNTVPNFWMRLRNRLRFGLATQEILDRLARVGVVIYPYYLVYEPIVPRPEAEALDQDLQIKRIQIDEAPMIASMPERPRDESKLRETLTRAACVAILENDELAAYSWFTREELRGMSGYDALCALPPHWAYLFDMYVRPKTRGRKAAVYMRHWVHQTLAREGVTHCCSMSLMFNRSTRRFKAKLGAIETELRLVLRLKPFPGLDVRLRRKPWPLPTPAIHLVRPTSRAKR